MLTPLVLTPSWGSRVGVLDIIILIIIIIIIIIIVHENELYSKIVHKLLAANFTI